MHFTRTLSWLFAVLLAGCGGETLSIGSNADGSSAVTNTAGTEAACEGPWDDTLRGTGAKNEFARLDAIGLGNWFGCPANPVSADIPDAIEVTHDSTYRLLPGPSGSYTRGPSLSGAVQYSLRDSNLTLELGRVPYFVILRESPAGFSLLGKTTKYRFVRK